MKKPPLKITKNRAKNNANHEQFNSMRCQYQKMVNKSHRTDIGRDRNMESEDMIQLHG